MSDNKQQKARINRMAKVLNGESTGAPHEVMSTKVSPQTYARVVRRAKMKGMSEYTLVQMVIDTLVRYMDDRHNLTPEMEQAMAIFEHMEGWRDAMNHADPTTRRIIGEAIYFLFDEDGKKKGCRAVHVMKPFFGNWSEDMNIQHILERCICLMMPERYRRLRQLAVDMDCSSLLELFDKLIDRHAKDSDVATFRELFEDAERSEWGKQPHTQPYKIRHRRTPDEMKSPSLFGDDEFANDSDKSEDEDLDFEDQIITP